MWRAVYRYFGTYTLDRLNAHFARIWQVEHVSLWSLLARRTQDFN